jgi:hypothetical protein
MDGYLAKPITSEDLLVVLKELHSPAHLLYAGTPAINGLNHLGDIPCTV